MPDAHALPNRVRHHALPRKVNILVFGGSFDPPHLAHQALLKAAAEKIMPDRILIVPAYQAPLKETPTASSSDRSRMIECGLIQALPRRWRRLTQVSRSELRLKRPVFTVETLRRLRRGRPDARLHFLVGSDSAASHDSWRDPAELKELAVWWTGRRRGASGAVPSYFRRVPGQFPKLSSSAIRQDIALGRNVSAFLSPGVHAYILKRNLYGLDILDRLARTLSPERYTHSLAVAELAAELSQRWGFHAARAVRAGLLHDCGRAIPVPKLAAYARRRRLRVPALALTALNAPLLLHAYVGEDLAQRRFGVKDPAVLSAIRHHTLGSPSMTPLDRLLYVADSCSRDRNYPQARILRDLAFEHFDHAFRACVRNKIKNARDSGSWLHPLTLRLWRALK